MCQGANDSETLWACAARQEQFRAPLDFTYRYCFERENVNGFDDKSKHTGTDGQWTSCKARNVPIDATDTAGRIESYNRPVFANM